MPPKAATKAERERWDKFRDIGCIACHQDGRKGVPGEVHHLLDGMKREGHGASVCLCPHHHRGIPPTGMTARDAAEMFGPSLANDARGFRARYGVDAELLAFQNRLLAESEGGGNGTDH